jgi:ring-1,2-phenylacetyl-CoA epoxidase subunit PaaC
MTTLSEPGNLDEREERALETLCKRLADDEFVIAERYTEWQVRAPTLESDLALSNIAQDELGHARLWYDILLDIGLEETDLVYERDPDEWVHSSLAEQPFEEGDWADPVVRSYLYDVAEEIRLEALEDSAYPKIADRVGKIQGEEDYHREHAQNWMERLVQGDGHDRVQAAVDRLFPHALTLFEPVDAEVESDIVSLGLRDRTLAEMGEEWLSIVVPYLESLDLDVPASGLDETEGYTVTEEMLPEHVGRDGSHSEAWETLVEEFTHTYRDLGRDQSTRIMDPPE